MKTILFMIGLILLITFSCTEIFSQEMIKKELIGEWEFVELRDEKGNRVDTIWQK
jgi:hypothetical protein